MQAITDGSDLIGDANPIVNYGKWCGPLHGGFQDCCNGTWCKSCGSGPKLGNYSYDFKLDCLTKECVPIDYIDMVCAWHDACTFVAGQACGKYYDGQHCFCNCVLYKAACHFSYRSKVCAAFSPWDVTMQCWSCLKEGDMLSPRSPWLATHNILGGINQANATCHTEGEVETFCQNTPYVVDMVLQLNRTGDPKLWDARKNKEACSIQKSR